MELNEDTVLMILKVSEISTAVRISMTCKRFNDHLYLSGYYSHKILQPHKFREYLESLISTTVTEVRDTFRSIIDMGYLTDDYVSSYFRGESILKPKLVVSPEEYVAIKRLISSYNSMNSNKIWKSSKGSYANDDKIYGHRIPKLIGYHLSFDIVMTNDILRYISSLPYSNLQCYYRDKRLQTTNYYKIIQPPDSFFGTNTEKFKEELVSKDLIIGRSYHISNVARGLQRYRDMGWKILITQRNH